jgi:hypothetical protein
MTAEKYIRFIVKKTRFESCLSIYSQEDYGILTEENLRLKNVKCLQYHLPFRMVERIRFTNI